MAIQRKGRSKGQRCSCKLGFLVAEARPVEVDVGGRIYVVAGTASHPQGIPGHRCDGLCGRWVPRPEFGDGRRRGDMLWRLAWSQHTRAFLAQNPWCERCALEQRKTAATESHHRQHRSMGGCDEFENLEPLCAMHHGLEHNQHRGGRHEAE